ncbi:MAG: hypothetical protein FJ100_15475 [Deltaproteobacteria bacterium]|nr:hypothetical protein [Deltaproteobacteria bacterium]
MTPERFAVGGACGPWLLHAEMDCAPPTHLARPVEATPRQPSLRCSVVRKARRAGNDRPHYRTDPRAADGHVEVQGRSIGVDLDWISGACQWSWPWPHQTDASTAVLIERSWLLSIQALALRHGGLLLHGCSLVKEGRAAVVVGPSGAGKTTLAGRLPALALHDDIVVLARQGPRWQVWAQDVYRPFGAAATGAFDLHRILWLSPRRDQIRAQPLGVGSTVMHVLGQVFDADGAAQAPLADAVAALVGTHGAWSLDHALADDDQQLLHALWGAT